MNFPMANRVHFPKSFAIRKICCIVSCMYLSLYFIIKTMKVKKHSNEQTAAADETICNAINKPLRLGLAGFS